VRRLNALAEMNRTLPLGGLAARPALGDLLMTAGIPAVVTVVLAGLTAGFFTWYASLGRLSSSPPAMEVALLAALPLAVAAALALWVGYARYFARRTDVAFVTALKYDAVSWGMLIFSWATFVGPFGAAQTGRTTGLAVAAFAVVKLAVAATLNRTVRDVAITFIVTRVPIILIAEFAAVLIGARPGSHYAASANPALAVWGRWDAEHYITIARQGYHGTDAAFFPLFPSLIWLLTKVTGNALVSGLIVSNVAVFFGLLFFYKLVEHQYNRSVAQRATFYASIFPTAIFFSAVYTESLFFALTVASFYYIRERKWITAGLIGYFAALTRSEGVLLAVPFFIEWVTLMWAVRKFPLDAFVRPIVGIALIPLGLLTYMAALWVINGDPLAFSHVQSHWGRHFAPPWVAFYNSIHIMSTSSSAVTIVNQFFELSFTLLMIGILIAGIRRLRPSYSIYMALSILIPMSTASLMSMPRFALVLFPMFAVMALWGERPTVHNAIVSFSLPILGLYTVLFANWYWVA
jgi:Gpi18-like mannosyltransferase